MPDRRKCPICGTTHAPARKDQGYCSSPCRQRAYRQRQRVWYGTPDGAVYLDKRLVGVLPNAPHVEWELTGITGEIPTMSVPKKALTYEETIELFCKLDRPMKPAEAAALMRVIADRLEHRPHLASVALDAAAEITNRQRLHGRRRLNP